MRDDTRTVEDQSEPKNPRSVHRSPPKSAPVGTRAPTRRHVREGPVGSPRSFQGASSNDGPKTTVVGMGAFKSYPPRKELSGSTTCGDGRLDASAASATTTSGTPECVVDERIQKRIEEEKQNDDHWAPGGSGGEGPYLVINGGTTHAEDAEGNRTGPGTEEPRGRPGQAPEGIGCVLLPSQTPLYPHSGELSLQNSDVGFVVACQLCETAP